VQRSIVNQDSLPKLRPPERDAKAIAVGSAPACANLRRKGLRIARHCAYAGSSMNPTLCEGDLLEIVPRGERPVRTGDVILFLPPEGAQPVVHRVVRVTPHGIQTRGDSSTADDPWLLRPADIVGQVVSAWRGQRRRKVRAGRAGWLLAHAFRWGRALERSVAPLLAPAYYSLVRSGIVRRLLPERLRPRAVIFEANGCRHLRLLLGRRVVGRYDDLHRLWRIQRPFHLFVDARSLPLYERFPR
jgi:hypothetical protein